MSGLVNVLQCKKQQFGMEMKDALLFQIDSYLRPSEAFHFVRKQLETEAPSPLHRHDYYELFLVADGRTRHWINGQVEDLLPGDLTFIRPADQHRFHADDTVGCCVLNTMFRPATADHLRARYGTDVDGRFFWSHDDMPVTLRLHGAALERAVTASMALQSSPRSLARIEAYLLSMMTFVLDQMPDVPRAAPAWLMTACEAAQQPEVFRQGAAGFIAAAGRGQEHVCRQTRRFLDTTPTQYVNGVRIRHAAMLLGSTAAPLDEVALDCGFSNMSYFHRLFRERYGRTPQDYRRRHRRDPIQPVASRS